MEGDSEQTASSCTQTEPWIRKSRSNWNQLNHWFGENHRWPLKWSHSTRLMGNRTVTQCWGGCPGPLPTGRLYPQEGEIKPEPGPWTQTSCWVRPPPPPVPSVLAKNVISTLNLISTLQGMKGGMNKLNASSTTRRQLGGKITRAFVFWTITGLISSRSHGYQEKNICLFVFFFKDRGPV